MKSNVGLKKEMRVEHQLLGKGTVKEIEPYNTAVVLIDFDNYPKNAQWMADGTLKVLEETE